MNNNYNLTYPSENDYYDINVFNNNFSKLADGIDEAKAGGYSGEIIIAAYNSTNPLKSCADYKCTQSDCTSILNAAVSKADNKGKIVLLDGDYYLENIWTINKSLHITGMGKFFTKIHEGDNSIKPNILRITGSEVLIDNIGFEINGNTGNSNLISIGNDKIEINSCYFYLPYNLNSADSAAPIVFECQFVYSSIKNCFFEKYKDDRYVIRAEDTYVIGTISGNFVRIIDTNTQIAVPVNLQSAQSYEQIDFGNQKTTVYLKGILMK